MKRIACLMPTYKRPNMAANALACFLAQDHPAEGCRLFILDDAQTTDGSNRNQLDPVINDRWEQHTSPTRFSTLPQKYNRLVELSKSWEPDGYAIWEDDDVFLSWHLSQIAQGFEDGVKFFRLPQVFSNYRCTKGDVRLEGAAGRFHSSWAFTKELCDSLHGWPETHRLDFDQQLGGRLREADPRPPMRSDYFPSYCYRWGSGAYNGSGHGEDGYKKLWDNLEKLSAPHVGVLKPLMDQETTMLYQKIWRP